VAANSASPRRGREAAPAFSFIVVFHERNRGKGAAVRSGFECVSGAVIVIQDADLEYDPNDWSLMLPLIVDRGVADVVYGSRFYGRPHRSLYYHHYIGNRIISIIFNILYDQMLSDIEVCYKMFTAEVLNKLVLSSEGFGFEVEISAQSHVQDVGASMKSGSAISVGPMKKVKRSIG